MSDVSQGLRVKEGEGKRGKRRRPAVHLLRNHALTKVILYFLPSKENISLIFLYKTLFRNDTTFSAKIFCQISVG